MKKRKLLAIVVVIAMISTLIPAAAFASGISNVEWWNYRNNISNNGITSRKTPTNSNTTSLMWQKQISSDYTSNCTPPLIMDNGVYTASGRYIYKLSKSTGKILKKSEKLDGGIGYTLNSMVYADGKIFIQIGNGQIQALNASTLKSLWISEKLGGQTLSPITYKNGYVFTGYWQGEIANGYYACYKTKDENTKTGHEIKKATWKKTPQDLGSKEAKGFYWAGAFANRNYVVFGSDDGSVGGDFTNTATLFSVNQKTGELIDKVENIKGDIRTTIAYRDGHLYFATKGGRLYKVAVSRNGKLGKESYIDLGGMITATPTIYNGRIYVGVCGEGGEFDADSGHSMAVINDTATLNSKSLAYKVATKGYPQSAALLSTQSMKSKGIVYVYFTYNAPPGGISYIIDKKGKTSGKLHYIYEPEANSRQYSISTICADKTGNLYYKNDSGYLMKIGKVPTYVKGVKITSSKGNVTWNEDFSAGNLGYKLKVPGNTTSVKVKISIPKGHKGYVNGKRYKKTMTVKLGSASKKTINIVSKYKNSRRAYKLVVYKESISTDLEDLKVSTSNTYNSGILDLDTEFKGETLDYTINNIGMNRNFVNIWPKALSEAAKITIYAKEGIGTKNVKDDKVQIADTNNGRDRYAVYLNSGVTSGRVIVRVFGKDSKTYKSYNIKINR